MLTDYFLTGTYFFSLNLHKRRSSDAPFAKVLVDGAVMFAVDECCNEDAYDNGSNTVLLPLVEGQQVWVELVATRVMATNNFGENTFTSFLLF